ncbi:hypothetical protein PFISCL1PPCAC_2378, partial [Pristionchus fissidentatus]
KMSYESFDHERCLDKCTVTIGGKEFLVSATILASRSNYFKQAFMEPAFKETMDRLHDLPPARVHSARSHRWFVASVLFLPSSNRFSGNSYIDLLKCADYFSADMILAEVENYVINNCCPSKWQANKKDASKPFCINLVRGAELAFEFNLSKTKIHIEKMLLRMRFHTFLRDYPDVMQIPDEIRLWIFDVYAKSIIASQKA